MARLGKRLKAIREAIDADKLYKIDEAIELLKSNSSVKFAESVDLSINLGVDPRKSDQVVRGATVLPHGTGRTVRVAVFAEGEQADAATAAGADVVGLEDLADSVKKGNIDFDVVIASPASMRIVGQLGQILGPKGMMPNPKVGTVTNDIETAVKNVKAGQARYRTDKTGIIHCRIGSVQFETQALVDNINTLISDLKKAKPSASKGVYLKKITLSTTMGPGLSIEQSSLSV